MINNKPTGIVIIGYGELLFGLMGIYPLINISLATLIAPLMLICIPFGIGLIRLKKWARIATIIYLGFWLLLSSGASLSIIAQQISRPRADDAYAAFMIFGLTSVVLLSAIVYLSLSRVKKSFAKKAEEGKKDIALMAMLKKICAGIFFLGIILLFFYFPVRPQAPFSKLQDQINSQVIQVYKTGQDERVVFNLAQQDEILVIAPPYADISVLGKDIFAPALKKKMQALVGSQETGHLFYIKQGRLIDHRMLSNLAEPILGIGAKKEVIFLISRKPTSGRSVRIEIEN